MRSSICVILAHVVSALVFIPTAASENRFVKMEMLAVKEVEVCPGGYGSGDCSGSDVLNKLDRLRRPHNSRTYELPIHPQDDFKVEELQLTIRMIHILAPRRGETPLSRRYSGLLVLYLGGEFKHVTVPTCKDIDTSPSFSSASASSSAKKRRYKTKGHSRFFYHCAGRHFLPYDAYEWSIQLDDSVIVFKFVQEKKS